MDILNPTAPAIPHHEATYGQAAIDDAEKNLSNFKKLTKEVTEEAKILEDAAKDLVKEVVFNVEEGMRKVEKGEWTGPEYQHSRENLKTKQAKPWEKMEARAEALRHKIDGPYKLVLASKENIIRARGDHVTGGVLGAITKDQKQVRKVYDNKMKFTFDEAAAAHDSLTSYPDGLLTQVALLHKRAINTLDSVGKKK